MSRIPECDDCEYRLWPVWCHAATTGHRRFCDLAHKLGRADYAEIVERETLGREPAKPPPANPWLRASLAARECVHHRAGCGCDGGRCVRPDKAGPTDFIRCAACLGIELPKPIT